ncbi:hypothetical protein ADUPG1_007115 [Aduncisulcus paluster]|uniref:Reverse transcriptase domain-containing protein n=1 Tax=Aduncisulcus paluster TaxID=2918883 RepID=A0ABQ5KKT3_9EUKA|nr:hypothetical protein ADUPG1_007115 [Aduncisulcus paluster]
MACGVAQGDLLSAFLFAITIHPIVELLHNRFGYIELEEDGVVTAKIPRVVAYLDNITVIVDSEDDMKEVMDLVSANLGPFGLSLNEDKCSVAPLFLVDPGDPEAVDRNDLQKIMGIWLSNHPKIMEECALKNLEKVVTEMKNNLPIFNVQNALEVIRTVCLPKFSFQIALSGISKLITIAVTIIFFTASNTSGDI